MRSDVRICNVGRIDLASHHKRSAPDPKSFLPVPIKKCCKRLLRNASHCTLALVHFCRVGFEFPEISVMWLSRFGKSRIAKLHPSDVCEVRCTRHICQEHNCSPTGFHSKPKCSGLTFGHRVLKVTGTVACHP